MFKRYSEQARRAIFFARSEATHQQADFISTSHILFGITWEENSRANTIASLKDNAVQLRSLLGIPHRPCSSVPYHSTRNIGLDRNSKMTLAYAAEEADKDKQFWIDTDHLLRGLLRFPNETASALQSAGIDLANARISSDSHRKTVPPQRSPYFPAIEYFFRSKILRSITSIAKTFVLSFLSVLILIIILEVLLSLFGK
jgi:ATP-dependent Clp protease ATP-binding subunit ClpA